MKEERIELAKRIHRHKTIFLFERKMKLLGLSNSIGVYTFLNIRLFISIILFLFVLIFYDFGVFLAPIITFLFYNGFSYVVFDGPIIKRKRKLEKEAMFFFEILTLSLESGKNLIQAIEVTTENVDSEISREFQKSLHEVKYGKSFYDAFTDLRKRMPSDTIENIILNIIEANDSGVNIISTLSQQVDYIRNKRIMDMKAIINKIPIKISVVSVILFIPLIMLLVLAPAIIQYLFG